MHAACIAGQLSKRWTAPWSPHSVSYGPTLGITGATSKNRVILWGSPSSSTARCGGHRTSGPVGQMDSLEDRRIKNPTFSAIPLDFGVDRKLREHIGNRHEVRVQQRHVAGMRSAGQVAHHAWSRSHDACPYSRSTPAAPALLLGYLATILNPLRRSVAPTCKILGVGRSTKEMAEASRLPGKTQPSTRSGQDRKMQVRL